MEITGVELQEKIKNGEKVIVELYATWCGPCKMLKPIFEKVVRENTTEVQMYTMDVDANREVASGLGIRSVPTIKTFNMGQTVDTKVGMLAESQINDLVKNLLNE
jgi:thioredoxin